MATCSRSGSSNERVCERFDLRASKTEPAPPLCAFSHSCFFEALPPPEQPVQLPVFVVCTHSLGLGCCEQLASAASSGLTNTQGYSYPSGCVVLCLETLVEGLRASCHAFFLPSVHKSALHAKLVPCRLVCVQPSRRSLHTCR